MSRTKRSIGVWIVAVVLIVAGYYIWISRTAIQDWITVKQYTPSAQVSAIAERSNMSDRGKFLFYASTPEVSEAQDFNLQCERREKTSAILGCYHGSRIYLLQISEKDLDGIQEVTASHEMLHAAWDRLSDDDKTIITKHLESVYDRVKTKELEERMDYYARAQPGERANELHSILGTEVASLDEVLDKHYQSYFIDRSVVVGLHSKYAGVFYQLERQASQLKLELEESSSQLNADIATYNAAINQLNIDTNAHNQKAASVDRTNADAVNTYNAYQNVLKSRRVELEQTKVDLDMRTTTYNTKLAEYNALALRSNNLINSIDSLKIQPHL